MIENASDEIFYPMKFGGMVLRLIISLVILGLVGYFGLPVILNGYLNRNADRIVSDMITRTTDFAGHKVHFGDIRIEYDFLGTELRLRDVKITPGDQGVEKEKIRFNLTLKEANLTGFRWRDFFLDNVISLDSAHLEDLEIVSSSPPLDQLEMAQVSRDKRAKQAARDYDRISLNHVRVNKLNFFNKDSFTDSTRISLKDLFLFSNQFVFTKEHRDNRNSLFDVAYVQGYMAAATVHLNDYRNVLTAKDLSFDTDDGKLIIEEIIFENKLEKNAYIRQFDKGTTWMELRRGKLELSGIDLASYFGTGQLNAVKLMVENPELDVFRDKRKPDDRQKRPKMIHEIIKSLDVKIRIDTISVHNMQVSYEERPNNESPRSGKIYFDQLNATIYPLTTYEEDLAENDTLHLIAQARLMGQGKINLTNRYYLLDEKGRFTMLGRVGGFDLTSVNQMVEPATRVAVKSGQLTELYFTVEGNDYDGSGELIAKYEKLEIEILDKNYGHDQNLFQRIGSFLANKLVVKSQNPTKRGELKKGAVYQVRDQSKFIFNYWWQLVLSGLKSTITGDTEEELREKSKKK